jgi:hypothetical protein
VKFALGLLLCLYVFSIHGEVAEDDIIALPELNLELLADENSDARYRFFEPFQGALSVSTYLREDSYYLSYLQLKTGNISMRGALKSADAAQANLQIKYRNTLCLGHFRPAFGQGLVFSQSTGSPRILNPPAPQSYAPMGLASQLSYHRWQLWALASTQARAVKLSDHRISSMPRTRQDYLTSSKEEISAVALCYETPHYHLGTLVYRQNYDLGFADPDLDSLLLINSVFGQASWGNHKLSLETAFQSTHTALKSEWQWQSGAYWHRWRYSYLGQYQRPAYAAKAMQISSLNQREEISAEIRYQALPTIRIKAASVLNRRLGNLSDPPWLAQSSIRISYQDQDSRLWATLKLIDREILSAIDSTYVSSIPLHYRVQLQGRHFLSESWSLDFSARYHHQEKHAGLSSGSWWQQSIRYQQKPWEISLGYAIWNSTNFRMIIADDSSLGYEAVGNNSLRLELSTSYTARLGQLQTRLRQSLKEPFTSTIELRLSVNLGSL